MIENLLYPKKLTEPPQLLVDPKVLFEGEVYSWDIPLVNSYNTADLISSPLIVQYRLIDVCSDGSNTFRLGFLDNVIGDKNNIGDFYLTMPFQDVEATIDEYRCHRWDSFGVDMTTEPAETQVKKTISHQAKIRAYEASVDDNSRYRLFKMKSDELDDSFPEMFFSNEVYSAIRYNRGSGFPQQLTNDFPEMYQHFQTNPDRQTLAIETIVKVKVDSGNTARGFRIGVLDASERLPDSGPR